MSLPVTLPVFETAAEVLQYIENKRINGMRIGFVPTMGALHAGHISLVEKSAEDNDVVVVSVFVNPTQFNNPEDLQKYPRTFDSDFEMLKGSGADALFFPSVDEIYPGFPKMKAEEDVVDLGQLEKVMEGKFRPGHFLGVVNVVNRLCKIVKPDTAYFGEKDFQQLAIIRLMVRQLNIPVKIIACPTIRETDGLAMSSRNLRLSPLERQEAARISKALFYLRDNCNNFSLEDLKQRCVSMIEEHGIMKVEYLEIADEETLQPARDWKQYSMLRCFTAVQLGNVRLIDNVKINVQSA